MAQEFDPLVLVDLLIRFGINSFAMLILIFGLYYRRYRDKELTITAALFNVFIFGVLTILSSVQFGIAAGFGLFAILALFTLRSEQISKTEITYFFGSVSIAVICSIQGSAYALVGLVVFFILLGAFVIDHPKVLRSVDRLKVTLNEIDASVLASPPTMRTQLSQRLGVDVMSYHVNALNYELGSARLTVYYRKR